MIRTFSFKTLGILKENAWSSFILLDLKIHGLLVMDPDSGILDP